MACDMAIIAAADHYEACRAGATRFDECSSSLSRLMGRFSEPLAPVWAAGSAYYKDYLTAGLSGFVNTELAMSFS